MDILLRADSARRAGIDVPEDAEQYAATVPDEHRPANLRDTEFSLSPRVVAGRLHLWLNDPISQWWGVNNEHLIHALGLAAADAPLTLHVNCPGGSVFDARAMQATLSGREVEARVEGLAASAASWLILAASRRTMTVGSRVVVHETNLSFRGNTTDLADLLPVMRAMDEEIAADYGAASGREASEWLAMMRAGKGRGTEMGAARAAELGLVEEIVDTAKPTTQAENAADPTESTRMDRPKPDRAAPPRNRLTGESMDLKELREKHAAALNKAEAIANSDDFSQEKFDAAIKEADGLEQRNQGVAAPGGTRCAGRRGERGGARGRGPAQRVARRIPRRARGLDPIVRRLDAGAEPGQFLAAGGRTPRNG